MAASTNDNIMAGPALFAAAIPVKENKPAPIITPTPIEINPKGPKLRFSVFDPVSFASFKSERIVFFLKSVLIC
jgi:hypothetical protein